MHRLPHVVVLPLLVAFLFGCAARPSPRATATEGAAAGARSSAGVTTPTPSTTTDLNVFAAASLTAAFQTIGKSFEAANPGTRVSFNFAGSQQLAQQIDQGAPADVFASADGKQMSTVVQAGLADGETARTFARNRLVVIYPASNPAKLATLQDLARPGVKIVLADKSVPVGNYALTFLDKASKDPSFGPAYRGGVLKNVVSYEQDVKAVLSKVALGEADAGIVYTTDVTPDAAAKVSRIDIPDSLNTIATYPIAAVKTSKHADLARKFVAYVLSPDGQAVLAKNGFIPTDGNAKRGT